MSGASDKESPMFHAHSGWYFQRRENGEVLIRKDRTGRRDNDDATEVFGLFDADAWASIVSSVSKGGEGDYRFYSAQKFHSSEGMVDVVPGNPIAI